MWCPGVLYFIRFRALRRVRGSKPATVRTASATPGAAAMTGVYGSALRADFGPDSDIDLLVEFEPDRIPGLLGIAGMEITLSELFAGRKVDLRTAEDLSPYFRQHVLNMAEVQYART